MFAFTVEDALEIKDRGIVITGHYNCTKYKIFTNSVLYDMVGNEYHVKGIEMFRWIEPPTDLEHYPIGLAIEPCGRSKEWFVGKVFTSEYTTSFVFPKDPFGNSVDECYTDEYAEAVNHRHGTILVDLEELTAGRKCSSVKPSDDIVHAVYRGWMLTPEQYERLYDELVEKNIFLINTPKQYAHCHCLPNWYNDFKEVTPFSVWSGDTAFQSLYSLLEQFGDEPIIVKDFVKSRKHEWYDACFIRSAAATRDALRVIYTFLERQADDLVGRIVLRKFEELIFRGYHPESGMKLSEEYRAFFLGGKLVRLMEYWRESTGGSGLTHSEREWLEELAERVPSNFFTIDIARKEDGSLIVMEIGDGQVSGIQDEMVHEFYEEVKL